MQSHRSFGGEQFTSYKTNHSTTNLTSLLSTLILPNFSNDLKTLFPVNPVTFNPAAFICIIEQVAFGATDEVQDPADETLHGLIEFVFLLARTLFVVLFPPDSLYTLTRYRKTLLQSSIFALPFTFEESDRNSSYVNDREEGVTSNDAGFTAFFFSFWLSSLTTFLFACNTICSRSLMTASSAIFSPSSSRLSLSKGFFRSFIPMRFDNSFCASLFSIRSVIVDLASSPFLCSSSLASSDSLSN